MSEEAALRARVIRLEALVGAAHLLNSTLALEEVLNRMLTLARDLLRAERSALFLVDRARSELWSKVASDLGGTGEIRMPLDAGIAGRVAVGGQRLRVDDAYELAFFNRDVDRRTGYRTRSVLCVPIRDARGDVLGVVELLNRLDGVFDEDDADFLQALADEAAIAIQKALLHEQLLLQQKLEQDMDTAAQVQRVLVSPPVLPTTALQTAAWFAPARQVGGDYYEVAPSGSERVLLAVGDVSGKGMPAALLMASLLGAMRQIVGQVTAPAAILELMNERLLAHPVESMLSTLYVASYHAPSRTLTFASAGHPAALLVRAGGDAVERLDCGGVVLGVLERQHYDEGSAALDPGDVLLLHSDGLPDARDPSGRRLGLPAVETMLLEAVRTGGSDVAAVLASLQDRVRRFTRDALQADDVSAVMARVP